MIQNIIIPENNLQSTPIILGVNVKDKRITAQYRIGGRFAPLTVIVLELTSGSILITTPALPVGTQIWQGVTFSSKTSAGHADSSEDEFILKNNTSYLLRYTSGTAGLKLLLRMIWYEDLGI